MQKNWPLCNDDDGSSTTIFQNFLIYFMHKDGGVKFKGAVDELRGDHKCIAPFERSESLLELF